MCRLSRGEKFGSYRGQQQFSEVAFHSTEQIEGIEVRWGVFRREESHWRAVGCPAILLCGKEGPGT